VVDNAPDRRAYGSEPYGAIRRSGRRFLLRWAAKRDATPGIRVLAYHLLPSAPVFAAHIETIRSVARIIDEDEFVETLDDPERLESEECRVLLTFDDGYRQHLTGEALDVVRDLGLRPTVFMVAAGVEPSLGRPHRLVRPQRHVDRPLVNAPELRAAVDAGWFVGSHTSTHWDCGSGDADDLAREIGGSKSILEACLGVEIRTFAYPFGKRENLQPAALDEVRRSGFRAAFTTSRGRIASSPASRVDLPRDVVEDWWGVRELRACLSGVLDRFGRRG
jgi:hypothetical protein